jgi:hypothetical protein
MVIKDIIVDRIDNVLFNFDRKRITTRSSAQKVYAQMRISVRNKNMKITIRNRKIQLIVNAGGLLWKTLFSRKNL